jgi:hypothetical protein
MPIDVTLNLQELVKLEELIEHRASGLIKQGAVFDRDPKRPARIAVLVARMFKGIPGLHFKLGTSATGGHYLVALFARGGNPDLLGRAKVPGSKWTPARGHSKATAHIYEGAIGNELVELLGGRADFDNVFASIVAHEIGHNLGLEHEHSPTGVMYAYEEASREQRKTWLQNASKGVLQLRAWQIEKIKLSLESPAAPPSRPGPRHALPPRR